MGTRSIVGTTTRTGFRGRYVHWDGYPTGVGVALQEMVKRDGVAATLKALTEDRYGWSSLNAHQPQEPLMRGMDDGRFVVVPGYGTAYTTEQGQSSPEEWHTSEDVDTWCEWAYALTESGIVVWVERDGGWGQVTTVKYDDPNGMADVERRAFA